MMDFKVIPYLLFLNPLPTFYLKFFYCTLIFRFLLILSVLLIKGFYLFLIYLPQYYIVNSLCPTFNDIQERVRQMSIFICRINQFLGE